MGKFGLLFLVLGAGALLWLWQRRSSNIEKHKQEASEENGKHNNPSSEDLIYDPKSKSYKPKNDIQD